MLQGIGLSRPLALLTVAAAIAAFAACTAGDGSNTGSGGNGAGSSTSSGTGASSSGTGGILFGGGGPTGGNTGVGGGCAENSIVAEKFPLDMYIMLDQSGSMSDAVQNGSKWSAVTSAITSFINQPAATGIGVGIQYFPADTGNQCPVFCYLDSDCGPCGPCFGAIPAIPFPGTCIGDDSCTVTDYSTPEVAIDVLPAVAQAISSSLSAHGPSGGTPTSAALQGALDYTTGWANGHPDHVVIIVLATDGDPTSCNTDLNFINSIAAAGAGGTPQILTFVIGVGSSLTALNGIAAAGGTGSAFLVDTNQDVTQQFLDALNVIQGTALGCVYDIPDPGQGQDPDYGKLNVEYTPGGSSEGEVIPKVAGPGDCPPAGDGWYYDDESNPTTIILCDSTCAKVSADNNGQVDIVLGCATVVK